LFSGNVLNALDWPALQAHLVGLCLTPYGQALWQQQPFLPPTPHTITVHSQAVCALQALLVRWGLPSGLLSNVPDLTPTLQRLTLGYAVAMAEAIDLPPQDLDPTPLWPVFGLPDLHHTRETITLARQLATFMANATTGNQQDPLQGLQTQGAKSLQALQPLYQTLNRSLSPEGLLNEATFPTLARLRQQLAQQRQQVNRQLEAVLRRLAQQPDTAMATQNQGITERNGRLVLPVRAGFQSSVPGWIHGASTGGGLVYIEPDSTIAGNNQCRLLLNQLEAEQERILADLSQQLGPNGPALQALCDWLGQLDRCLAGAQLARQLEASFVPMLPADGPTGISLHGLRHPLLLLQAKASGRDWSAIVRNTVQLGATPTSTATSTARTLLITGPNTGGKTVLMKAVGLCALLLAAGLPLPVSDHPDNGLSLFSHLVVDMGDQQSVSDQLSTFSAHIHTLLPCLQGSVQRHLVLLDEIGTGTDPDEGAALAEAILETLTQGQALTIATSHLGRLKLLPTAHNQMQNASMSFNPELMQPTYQLIMGIPGTSHALSIAQRLGMPPLLIERARAVMSAPVRDSASLLEDMAYERHKLHEARTEAEAFRRSAKQSYQKTEGLKQQLEADKRKIIQQFKASLKDRLLSLERRVEQLTQQITREGLAVDTQRLEALAKKKPMLENWGMETLNTATDELEAMRPKLKAHQLAVGDTVFSQRLNMKATVLALPTSPLGDVTLEAGLLKMTVPWDDLERLGAGPNSPKLVVKKHKPITVADMKPALVADKPSPDGDWILPAWICDVRGQRAEDALERVAQHVDQALLEGVDKLAVVHGLGTGALKKAVRTWLKASPNVGDYGPAPAVEGGDGKTIIRLK
jgi:DNA mismatch repair protein MutS2